MQTGTAKINEWLLAVVISFVIIFGGIALFFLLLSLSLNETGKDTIAVLNKKEHVEIGVLPSEIYGNNVVLCQIKGSCVEPLIQFVCLYKVKKPLVYIIDSEKVYHVFDFDEVISVATAKDLSSLKPEYRTVFSDKSGFTDVTGSYDTSADGEEKQVINYPRLSFGDYIYLEYNCLIDVYYLKSAIASGEKAFDFKLTDKMTQGFPVEGVRKLLVKGPLLFVIDQNGKRTVVDDQTQECVYSEYLDQEIPPEYKSVFAETGRFQTAQDLLKP